VCKSVQIFILRIISNLINDAVPMMSKWQIVSKGNFLFLPSELKVFVNDSVFKFG